MASYACRLRLHWEIADGRQAVGDDCAWFGDGCGPVPEAVNGPGDDAVAFAQPAVIGVLPDLGCSLMDALDGRRRARALSVRVCAGAVGKVDAGVSGWRSTTVGWCGSLARRGDLAEC